MERSGKDMKRKITVLTLGALLFALCDSVDAQQTTKIPIIGILGGASSPSARLDAFRREFRKLGYVEGKNIAFESRYAENKLERLPFLAAELVRLKVDVIVTPGANDPELPRTLPGRFPSSFWEWYPILFRLGWLTAWRRLGATLQASLRLAECWRANSLSYSRRLFPSSPGSRCCGMRRMRARRKYGKKANLQQRNSVCNFIPWR